MSSSFFTNSLFIFALQVIRNMVCSIGFVGSAIMVNDWCAGVHFNTNLFIPIVSGAAVGTILAFLITKKISQLDDMLDQPEPIQFDGAALPTAQLIVNQLMRAGRSDTIWKLEHTSIDQRQLTFSTPVEYSDYELSSQGISMTKVYTKMRMRILLSSEKNFTNARLAFTHENNRNHFREAKENAIAEAKAIATDSSKLKAIQPTLQMLTIR